MIEIIKKNIIGSNILGNSVGPTDLDLLKYSTPVYKQSLDGKVIFIVFLKSKEEPVLIVKTVRDYKYAKVIKEGYQKLEEIKDMVEDTKYNNLFPQPILLYDDKKEFIFSIESYHGGLNTARNIKNLPRVTNLYTDFQKTLNKSKSSSLLLYGKNLIKSLNLDTQDESFLEKHLVNIQGKPGRDVFLIDQHGDLTPDNIFITKGGIRIIDCDRFGEVQLAGYDIYRFVLRVDPNKVQESLHKYFFSMDLNIKPDKATIFLYYLHDLLFKHKYIADKISAQDIINRFEAQYELVK